MHVSLVHRIEAAINEADLSVACNGRLIGRSDPQGHNHFAAHCDKFKELGEDARSISTPMVRRECAHLMELDGCTSLVDGPDRGTDGPARITCDDEADPAPFLACELPQV